ncbi:protein phosphatase 1, regulatory subunit [Trypanosoma rangeli]|uniref:Protein phosphatase 1, regulatory subunit n=1 Tax=Trypanosoma rangeli TaxID=5698 RepID=A0A3R7JZE2_TRYRA|nr:protein phosphatase 1, regulatory subunit [Trypanosoma rangeli]RNE99307.1 protein phosphatase 1, regulatory subunit [Trypanosoma rangeli]|eukprot:RNE99307.1 protein phosphatase 1, regulatory subunit [Trypanosoma rangeli]
MSQGVEHSKQEADLKADKREKLRRGLEALFAAQNTGAHKDSDEDSADEGHPAVDNKRRESQTATDTFFNIDTNSTIIEVNNVRLFSLDELELDKLTNCVSLSLRKNLIHELTPFPEELAGRLQDLDFFDNKIRKLRDFFSSVKSMGDAPLKKSVLGAFGHLTKLDLSYNQIRHISGLEPLAPTLKELYLVENKINEIKNLDLLTNLELLELGGNRIREIGPGLANLTKLKQLWLGKNKITSIGTSLQTLVSLEILSLQANRLTSIEPENFSSPDANPCLMEVYLSENGLTSIQNLQYLSMVKIIDFSFNPISVINADVINPKNMPFLVEFWLTDGKVENWDEVGKLSGFKNSLKTVYLERNPIEEDKRYRDKVYMYLPFLEQIDSWPIVNKGNLEADRKRRA